MEKQRCKQCEWKSPTRHQTMNSAAFKGTEAADMTALLHELAARGCKKKTQSKCKVVFPSCIYSSLQNNTPHKYESICYKDDVF